MAFTGLGEIRLWNTKTGDEQAIPLADLSLGPVFLTIYPTFWHWRFRHMVHGSSVELIGGKIQMWDVATGGALTVFAEPTAQEDLGRILALAFSPDGTLLAAGTRGHIHLWEVDTA